jgi:hypothetical protein
MKLTIPEKMISSLSDLLAPLDIKIGEARTIGGGRMEVDAYVTGKNFVASKELLQEAGIIVESF